MAEQIIPPDYKARSGSLGTPTNFERTQYETSGLMYPADLMAETNNQYGGNYVIFYINVHDDSMLYQQNKAAFVEGNIPPQERGSAAGRLTEGGVRAAGTVAGAVLANKLDPTARVLKAGGAKSTPVAELVGDTLVGGVAANVVIETVGGPKAEYKRQKRAIALHVPTDLSIKYGMQWEESMPGMALAQAVAENLSNVGNLNIPAAIKGAVSYGASLALQAPAGELLAKTSGTAANPKKEMMFKNVDWRTFTFSYQFFPRSEEEAAQVRAIIKEFKLHMHPEFRPNTQQFLYIYPSEFDIFYYQNGKENMNLHRHTSCVLTDMNVSYAPQGQFNTFKDGMPTQINVTLTFKELALLTKVNIMDGF